MILRKNITVSIRAFLSILSCFLWLLTASVQAQQTILPAQLPECPVKRVMDATLTSNDVLWVVGEQSGVYSLDLRDPAATWAHVSADAAFDPATNYYAIIEDKQGRIWIGTDNQGVLVSDGKGWKSYTVDNALLANRVYDLTVSPFTGEVAIATSSGVSIFNPQDQSWKDFTRANGLMEDQVSSLVFTKDGVIWFAYACGGLTKAAISHLPTSWKHVKAPWKWDEKGFVRQPLTPSGMGLSSNQNNAIIASQEALWAATCAGLAYAPVKGGTWKYVRGADWLDKNKGNYTPGKTVKWNEAQTRNLLPQDHVSTLALAKQGGLWVGTRDKGICRWSPQGGVLEKLELPDKLDNYEITSLVTFPDGSLGYGSNGQGFGIVRKGAGTWKSGTRVKTIAESPAPPTLPGEEQIVNLLEQAMKQPSSESDAVYVGEDWMTKGDWPGRYGNVYALLCAASGGEMDGRFPTAFIFGERRKYLTEDMYAVLQDYDIEGFKGRRVNGSDSYKSMIYDDDSENRNALISPNDFKRKEAVWDDGGSNCHYTCDGPDLWVKIIMPEGKHFLDLYYYNQANDMESDSLKADYLVELRKEPSVNNEKEPTEKSFAKYENNLYSLPVLARARVHRFSGSGVYQKFAAQGQGTYWFRICRNNAPSAQLNGIFISKLVTPQEFNPDLMKKANRHFGKRLPLPGKLQLNGNKDHKDFLGLWEQSSKAHSLLPFGQSAFQKGLLYQYRKLKEKEENKNLKDMLGWIISMETKESRQEFDRLMSGAKSIQQEQDKRLREQLKIPSPPSND